MRARTCSGSARFSTICLPAAARTPQAPHSRRCSALSAARQGRPAGECDGLGRTCRRVSVASRRRRSSKSREGRWLRPWLRCARTSKSFSTRRKSPRHAGTVPPGTLIVCQGEPAEAAYIITSGTCEVYRAAGEERVVLRRLGPNDVFGETAVLTGEPRSRQASSPSTR